MKLARVNLEPESFGDPRFAHLARLLGMPGGDGHFALIKVALIWSWQTEHYTPESPCFHVPEDVVEMALGVDGAAARAALVRARLAEETPDGLRMRGSSHERTGWLWRIRARAEAGGHAKSVAAKRKKANESLPQADTGHAQGVPQETPLSSSLSVPEEYLSPARAGDSGQDRGALPDALATEPPAPIASSPVQAPPPLEAVAEPRHPSLAQLHDRAIDMLNEARRRIDPSAPPLSPVQGQPGRDLLDHLRPIPADRRLAELERAIAVMAATLEADGSPVGDYRMAMLSGPRAWERWLAGTVEAARAPRPARGRAGRIQPPGSPPAHPRKFL